MARTIDGFQRILEDITGNESTMDDMQAKLQEIRNQVRTGTLSEENRAILDAVKQQRIAGHAHVFKSGEMAADMTAVANLSGRINNEVRAIEAAEKYKRENPEIVEKAIERKKAFDAMTPEEKTAAMDKVKADEQDQRMETAQKQFASLTGGMDLKEALDSDDPSIKQRVDFILKRNGLEESDFKQAEPVQLEAVPEPAAAPEELVDAINLDSEVVHEPAPATFDGPRDMLSDPAMSEIVDNATQAAATKIDDLGEKLRGIYNGTIDPNEYEEVKATLVQELRDAGMPEQNINTAIDAMTMRGYSEPEPAPAQDKSDWDAQYEEQVAKWDQAREQYLDDLDNGKIHTGLDTDGPSQEQIEQWEASTIPADRMEQMARDAAEIDIPPAGFEPAEPSQEEIEQARQDQIEQWEATTIPVDRMEEMMNEARAADQTTPPPGFDPEQAEGFDDIETSFSDQLDEFEKFKQQADAEFANFEQETKRAFDNFKM